MNNAYDKIAAELKEFVQHYNMIYSKNALLWFYCRSCKYSYSFLYRVIILYVCNKRQKNTLYATKVIQHYEFSLLRNEFLIKPLIVKLSMIIYVCIWFQVMWLFREVSSPYLFVLAQIDPDIKWRAHSFRLKFGGIAELREQVYSISLYHM